MKKTFLKNALLAVVSVGLLAGNAMASQMIWEETNSDILAFDGDLTQTSFASDQLYTVNIELLDPGYKTLTWSINSFAMSGWESTGPYQDSFTIKAYLDGTEIASSFSYPANAPTQTAWTYFEIDLSMYSQSGNEPFTGMLTIENYATTTGGTAEIWQLLDAELATCDPVPEPATMLLFGTGLAGLAGFSRKKSKKA